MAHSLRASPDLDSHHGTTPMTSLAQFEANRRNAALSTGPRSVEGKLVSRENSLKHGFRADTVLAPTEADLLPDYFITWRSSFKVRDDVDLTLAREAGLMNLRLD